jgi:hypothetical protein
VPLVPLPWHEASEADQAGEGDEVPDPEAPNDHEQDPSDDDDPTERDAGGRRRELDGLAEETSTTPKKCYQVDSSSGGSGCIDRTKRKLVLVLSGKVVVMIRSSRRSRKLRPSNQCSV